MDIILSAPGSKAQGTNPEQLLAAGWSACYISALGIAAAKQQVTLPGDLYVAAEVDLGTGQGGFLLQARLQVSLPGVDRDVAEALIETAHQTCPYPKALSGNIPIQTIFV